MNPSQIQSFASHYLSVNTLDALDSKTNNYRTKSPRLWSFARYFKNCWILNTAKARTQSGSGVGEEHQQQMMENMMLR